MTAPDPHGGGPVTRRRERVLAWAALAVAAYLPPLLSAPGEVAADTKSYLYLDPGRLLGRAASMWDPNVGLGTVTHQTIGYLFPMGPYYWLLDTLGVPDWVAQRVWLGTIVFAAAAGVVFLLRTLGVRGVGVAVAAATYAFSPYALHYSARISVILLPWAALGWMLALTIRALRSGGWRHPALFALLVQVIGGVNATALLFAGVAPVAWVLWATFGTREVTWQRAAATTARIGVLTTAASAWWIAGLSLQSGYGINVLQYTETVRAVARTSMPNEVLRGLGYWFFYGRDRLGPWIEAASSYTQRPVVILAGYGLAVLALASAGVIRWRHRAFFVFLAVTGVVIAVGAHPYDDPTPLGSVFKAFATSSTAGLALRSTGRAIPLVTLALAVLLGRGVDVGMDALRRRRRGRVAWAVPAVVAALLVASFPALYDGSYYGENLQRPEEIPQYWDDAAEFLDARGHDTRVLELPGSDFASYTWGNTVDPITPGLIDRPYVARELIPYGTPGTADLLNALDRRFQEGVEDPSGLAALLRRLGVGDVVLRNDLEYGRFNTPAPAQLAASLRDDVDGIALAATFGPLASGSGGRFVDERDYLVDDGAPPPVAVHEVEDPWSIVRAETARGALVVAGDGEGLVDLAEAGLLDHDRVVVQSASFGTDETAALRRLAGDDAVLVLTDTNRRRARRWTTVRDNTGHTEARGERPLAEADGDARLPVFPDAPPRSSTSVVQRGVRRVVASSYGNPITFTPEDRAARAFDGDLTTAWKTAAFAEAVGERISVELEERVRSDHVELVQLLTGPQDRFITEVELRFDGGDPLTVALDGSSRAADGQRISFPMRAFRRLEVRISATNYGRPTYIGPANSVGFAEIRVRPEGSARDVQVDEVVRLPRALLEQFGDEALAHPLVVVMTRLRSQQVPPRSDEEVALVRELRLPDARAFSVTAQARLTADAPSATLDELLGRSGGVTATASRSLPGCARCLPAHALDGDPDTAWQSPIGAVVGEWVEVALPAPTRVDRLELQLIDDSRHSVPTRLRVEGGGAAHEIDVPAADAEGVRTVTFPALRADRIRVSIVAVAERRAPSFYTDAPQVLPAGVRELGIAGVSVAPVPEELRTPCRGDLVTVDGDPFPVRVTGRTDDALARRPLLIEPCGRVEATLGAGTHELRTAPGRVTGLDVDRIVLASSAGGRRGLPIVDGKVTDLGSPDVDVPVVRVTSAGRTRTEVEITGASEPFWLVLGQSHSTGWRATLAGGGSLGSPRLVDGYANGWYVDLGERDAATVTMEWTPQRRVWFALAISALAVLLCVGIVVATRRQRLPELAPIDARVTLRSPFVGSAPLARGASVIGPLVGGTAAAIVVAPWAGAVVAAAVLATVRTRHGRSILTVLPAGLVALAAVYIVRNQIRYDLPPVFEWPTFFPRARSLAWLAVVLLGADALVEVLERRRGTRSDPPVRSPSSRAARRAGGTTDR
ncbi:MAG TPA: alpha-(1-_3)-arabinofuranosyltransferase family protein [Acidimicrobiia bacterium]|nr:alpha-(1->3)-arabinofuranosyltransferase family protein [Acidimicrobiia bacterium]